MRVRPSCPVSVVNILAARRRVIRRDDSFVAINTLLAYADEAQEAGAIEVWPSG
jgi:hypothetical protein